MLNIPATKAGKDFLNMPDNPLKNSFLKWARLKFGNDFLGLKLSTYTDGEPYFKHPSGVEISLRDFLNAREEE